MKYIIAPLILLFAISARAQDRVKEIRSLAEQIIELTEPEPFPEPTISYGLPYTVQQLEQGRPKPLEWEAWMEVPTITGKIIHICPTGNDANDGLTPDTAKATLSAFRKAWTDDFNGGDAILFCKGGVWHSAELIRLSRLNDCSKDSFCTIGAYGEGDNPLINVASLQFEGKEYDPIQGIYWRDLEFIGEGYGVSGLNAFLIWDDVSYFVWNNVKISNYFGAINISVGRKGDGFLNDKFAILNSTQEWNRGGIFTDAGGVFIDYNTARYNGNNGAGRNYYFFGQPDGSSSRVVLQRSSSRNNSPTGGLAEGGCLGTHLTLHGRLDQGVYIIDNDFREPKGEANGRCWGYGIDSGREAAWGDESFSNVVFTGNIAHYLGNTAVSLTNIRGGLFGWNDIKMDASNESARGFNLPSKVSWDKATPSKDVSFVYNKIAIEGFRVWHDPTWGIRVGDPDTGNVIEGLEIEYNDITVSDKNQVCIMVDNVAVKELGTNTCTIK